MDALDHFYIEELPWSSMTRYREATDALRTVGEQRFQLSVSALHGKRLHDLGDLTGAEADLRASLAQARRLGDALPLAWLMVYLARLLARTTQIESLGEPEELARDVIATKNPTFMADAHDALAEIKRRQGDLVGAEQEARIACESARPFPGLAWGPIALHACILLEQGRAEEALAVAEAGVREIERLGLEGSGEIDLRLSWAEALHAVGRVEAAHAALSDTIPRLKKRLDDIPESAARERYPTNVPANARVVALAREWLGEEVRALGP
jgi:hypothetical protein